jgi:hypothetical protein
MVRTILVVALAVGAATAQQRENTDEAKVGNYTLLDPLTMQNGKAVKDARGWTAERRPELVRIFEEQVFGRTVAPKTKVLAEVVEAGAPALGGKAVRKQVTLWFTGKKEGPKVDVLMYLPAGAGKPAPVFVGLNFGTNASVVADQGIRLGDAWVRDPQDRTRRMKVATPESTRGSDAESWQVEKILAHGFGLVTASYQDIEPDFDGGMKYGVRPLGFRAGQTAPAADEWGAIGAWAWGLSRIVDYVAADKAVDAKKIALIGHSRLGKTALWAGAQDLRFALVVSNDSGEGGAALARRNYGETLEQITRNFPHWFCANYKQYAGDPNRLPVDSHELLALMAPRPVYVASAEEDRHADPRGEFLGAVGAGRVYELLGKQGLGTDEMPGIHKPIMKTVGYHIRAGKHDVTAYDWDQYLKFAEMHFGR